MSANTTLETCPRCKALTEKGFCHRATGLSFVAAGKLKSFVSVDEDLGKAGLVRKLLPSKAEYFTSFLCRACSLYVVDYGKSLSSAEAKALAKSISNLAPSSPPN